MISALMFILFAPLFAFILRSSYWYYAFNFSNHMSGGTRCSWWLNNGAFEFKIMLCNVICWTIVLAWIINIYYITQTYVHCNCWMKTEFVFTCTDHDNKYCQNRKRSCPQHQITFCHETCNLLLVPTPSKSVMPTEIKIQGCLNVCWYVYKLKYENISTF